MAAKTLSICNFAGVNQNYVTLLRYPSTYDLLTLKTIIIIRYMKKYFNI